MDSPDKVTINLNKNEALILFDFVSRFNEIEDGTKVIMDKAEEKIMWEIEGQLQKILAEPFMADYRDRLNTAKREIIDNY